MEIVASGSVWLAPGGLDLPFGDISFGDSFSLRIVFDSDSPDLCALDPSSCGPSGASRYRGTSMTARVGNEEFAWGLVTIRICDVCEPGFASDSFTISAVPESEVGSGEIGGGVELFDSASSNPLDTQFLPKSLELADWSHRELALARGSFGERVQASITSLVLRPVPEPSVAGLIVFALAGLAAARAAR